MSDELARRSVEEAWLRILRRRHPDVIWTARPRSQRHTTPLPREIAEACDENRPGDSPCEASDGWHLD